MFERERTADPADEEGAQLDEELERVGVDHLVDGVLNHYYY